MTTPADGAGPFAVLLQRYRQAAGLSQEELAERAGLSARGISDLERGVRRSPYPVTMRALADALALNEPERAAFLVATRSQDKDGMPAEQVLAPLTSLIGREREVAELRRLLGTCRLLTLTGAGGVGKTRLALEVARAAADAACVGLAPLTDGSLVPEAVAATLDLQERANVPPGETRLAPDAASDVQLDRYSDGVWVVNLAPVADPQLVAATIARTLGIRERAGVSLRDSLIGYLRARRSLLLLDNFEHLLDAALLVSDLLVACPLLTVLATSREPLRLRHEQQFPVPPLAVLPAGATLEIATIRECASVQLFAQRAAQIAPDFRVTPDNACVIVDICRRLDGLPLAIELAAPRLKLLSLTTLLERLEHRLPLLVGGARDLPARQQTLRATLAWSYDLLEPGDQRLFQQLALFAGGCTLDAVESVCQAAADGNRSVLEGVSALVDKSLLQLQGADGPQDEPRFTMLETIREFALDHLAVSGEEAALRERYVGYFLAMVEQAESALLSGRGQLAALARLEREQDNLRTALQLAAEHDAAELELRLSGAAAYFWIMRGQFTEALARLGSALSRGRSAPAGVRAKALAYVRYLTLQQGDVAAAERALDEAQSLADECGHPLLRALVLVNRGFVARAQARNAAELDLFESAMCLAHAAHVPPSSILRYQHANAVLRLGDVERAAKLHQENLSDAQAVGDTYSAAAVLFDLGLIALRRGDVDGAQARCRDALAGAEELSELLIAEFCLEALAVIAGLQGRARQAAVLLGAATRCCERTGTPPPGAPGTEWRLPVPGGLDVRQLIENAQSALGEADFAAALRTGATLPLHHVLAQAT